MKKFMSLFLALIMVCSLSIPAFALTQRFNADCAICGNTFSVFSGVENAVTYQEYYHISDISGLENDTQTYGISEALCVGKYNGGRICKSCLENIINANWPYKTAVSYDGQGEEAYTVTVPASLTPGTTSIIPGSIGVVKVEGTWASNRKLCVSAPSTVTLTNSIDGGTKVLDVMFQGIAKIGDNTAPISVTGNILVNKITNALFGTWTGTITYTVSMIDVT